MFELMKHDGEAINLLKNDHKKVKELFEAFEASENVRERKKIALQAIHELKVHTTIEEEIFYPAVRAAVGDKDMNEADEEHHVAKMLIAELELMNGTEPHFEAKFWVLAENIRHHIKEEEGEIFPKAKHSDIDFEFLGERLRVRKQQLTKQGIPLSPEEKMFFARQPKSARSAHPKSKAVKRSKAGKPAAHVAAAMKGKHKGSHHLNG